MTLLDTSNFVVLRRRRIIDPSLLDLTSSVKTMISPNKTHTIY